MSKRKTPSRVTRRHLMTAGRTALVGLAGATFVAAARTSTQPLTGEATQRHDHHAGKGHASHPKHKKGHRKQKGQHKKHKQHKQHKGKKIRGDIQLSTGSVLPESLVEVQGGQLSAHMLLPFESFPTEDKLAQAVADAEKMNLFILPKGTPVANS